ncbi:MAG: CDP-glycerol glycerophosphotransferase family protein [Dysgonomonas sp.]
MYYKQLVHPAFQRIGNGIRFFFKVAETGWSKFDDYTPDKTSLLSHEKPTVIYAPTFTHKLNSAADLYDAIEKLIKEKDWKWYFSFHPKMDRETIDKYKHLASEHDNVVFSEVDDKLQLFREADVMLSDTSSVIYEFLWLDKPAVTYKNTFPADHLIDIDNPEMLEAAIEKALSKPADLMENIRNFMDQVHPYRDGKSSARILDAVDDFEKNYKGKLKKKPLNLFRKLKMRKKAHYFPFGTFYRKKAK